MINNYVAQNLKLHVLLLVPVMVGLLTATDVFGKLNTTTAVSKEKVGSLYFEV